MPIDKPYRRTARPFVGNAGYRGGWPRSYLGDPRFAPSVLPYLRAFDLLQKDLAELFDYVEPVDANASCYSYRIHALLQRACMEVEANLRAVLLENGYQARNQSLGMIDYRKVDQSHRLSAIRVEVLPWHGKRRVMAPFEPWSREQALPWYQAYNQSKHGRVNAFGMATIGALVESVAACAALIVAQFVDMDPSPTVQIVAGGPDFPWDVEKGLFVVRLPRDWQEAEHYNSLNLDVEEPFQNFPYPPPK